MLVAIYHQLLYMFYPKAPLKQLFIESYEKNKIKAFKWDVSSQTIYANL